MRQQGILLSGIGNAWDYLNGTKIGFGIGGTNADSVLIAIYDIIRKGSIIVAILLIVAAIIGMIFAGNAQERAAAKNGLFQRFFALFLIGASTGLLSFLMNVFNIIFGISTS